MTAIATFGCRLNGHESDVIAAHTAHLADTLIVNTCAVTAEAEHDARKAIRRAVRENPHGKIVVTGCAAQIDPAAWRQLPGVTRVVGNAEKLRAGTWTHEADAVGDIFRATQAASAIADRTRTRAILQIQQGCDHHCTFCIIPKGRGFSRSVDPDAVVARARILAAAHHEIVLSGVDIASYGGDLADRTTLGELCRRVLRETPVARLRLSSLDPAAIDDDLFRVLADEARMMPHWHLSLQAASDMVLKRMRRRHLRADAEALVARARAARPGMVFGADVIAGFPTETDAMFAETDAFVRDHVTHVHAFPYSERPGTPAARMPPVPAVVRRARAAALRAGGADNLSRHCVARVGMRARVLVEAGGTGHDEHFCRVRVGAARGTLADVIITAATDGVLYA